MGVAALDGLKAGANWYNKSVDSAQHYLEPAQREILGNHFRDMLADLGMNQHIAFAETTRSLPDSLKGNLVAANEIGSPAAAPAQEVSRDTNQIS